MVHFLKVHNDLCCGRKRQKIRLTALNLRQIGLSKTAHIQQTTSAAAPVVCGRIKCQKIRC